MSVRAGQREAVRQTDGGGDGRIEAGKVNSARASESACGVASSPAVTRRDISQRHISRPRREPAVDTAMQATRIVTALGVTRIATAKLATRLECAATSAREPSL